MIGRERDRRVDRLEPLADRLLRQPHHQIEAHVVEAGGARILIRGGGAIGVVEPREAAQLRVAKRLHADAQAIHAGVAVGGEARRVNRLGVRFERHLAIARDVERLLARADDATHLAWLEERRRAAAEVDRVGGQPPGP